MVSLAQKLKMPKTCDKRLYKHIRLVLCKKRLQKTGNIWEMRPFWKLAKMATMQWLWLLQSGQFGSKIKIAKSMRKTAVEGHYSCIMQKTAPKNKESSKNETILRIGKNGHYAKAIAFAKWSVWVKN